MDKSHFIETQCSYFRVSRVSGRRRWLLLTPLLKQPVRFCICFINWNNSGTIITVGVISRLRVKGLKVQIKATYGFGFFVMKWRKCKCSVQTFLTVIKLVWSLRTNKQLFCQVLASQTKTRSYEQEKIDADSVQRVKWNRNHKQRWPDINVKQRDTCKATFYICFPPIARRKEILRCKSTKDERHKPLSLWS